MADSEFPPVEVEVWCRVEHNPEMYKIGSLEYPFPGPQDMRDFLREFAQQILEQVDNF